MKTDYLISKDHPLLILFVEDNEVNRFYISKIVNNLNDKVEMVENGQEAVNKATKVFYDFIFMDINMPVMGGFEAVQKIRKLSVPYSNSPIIGMTNGNVDLNPSLSKASGINDFIDKYFTIEDLKSKVQFWKGNSDPFQTTLASSDSQLNKVKSSAAKSKMISIFMDQREEFIEKMEMGIQDKNWEDLYFLIHKIKSSVEVIHIPEAKAILDKLEQNSKEMDMQGLQENYRKIILALREFKPE